MNSKNLTAVILAAGKSSRFSPYSTINHKSLIPIMGKPIIEHTLCSLKDVGINNIIIVESASNSIRNFIGDGEKLGIKITYVTQQEPRGMGDGLLQAARHLVSDFVLLHAYHFDVKNFIGDMIIKKKQDNEIVLLATKTNASQRYGMLKVDGDIVTEIVEKPTHNSLNLKTVGIYMLNPDFIYTLKKTPLEHYHFEKALSEYSKAGKVKVHITSKKTVTLKYAWDLLEIKDYLLQNIYSYISKDAFLDKSAEISGPVFIEEGARIMEGARIKGPCYIGRNAYVGTNSFLRNGVDIEENSVVGAYLELKNSIMLPNSKTHSGFIGDSIIGSNCRIAASMCTGNVRLDRKPITVTINDEAIPSGLTSLGVLIGNNVNIGIRVSTMPGVIIGSDSIIGPATLVKKNIDQNVLFYTKFQEFIEKKNGLQKESIQEDTKQKLVLFDIDHTLFDTEAFKESKLTTPILYKEVLDVIAKLEETALLGIFSEGDAAFQKSKLQNTNIYKYFMEDYIHIASKKDEILKNILERYKNTLLFLVDDKLEILYKAKQLMPETHTIWIKRGIYAQNQKPINGFKPDSTVSTLEEIVSIVENKS